MPRDLFETIEVIDNLQEKDYFIDFIKSLSNVAPVIIQYLVTTNQLRLQKILNQETMKKIKKQLVF